MRLIKTSSFVLAFVLIASCSSGPHGSSDSAPAWVHQSARTVDNGYIVYVGTAEDYNLERARFKAESAALEDLANECSFAPKGTRVEDRYDVVDGSFRRAYAKVAVEFQECEQAKEAVEPEQIRKVANVAMADEIKRYQEITESEQEPQNESSEDESAANANPALANTQNPPAIHDQTQFFVVRQQVAYMKEIVILSPPTTYAANTPQATQFTRTVSPSTTQLQQYEKANPVIRTAPTTWSTLPQRPRVTLPQHYQATRASLVRPARRLNFSRREFQQRPNAGNGKKQYRKRRRRDWN